jgi:hypothetical protein
VTQAGEGTAFDRLERRLTRLARSMIERFTAEIPLYGMLPREQLEGEILDVTVDNLRVFLATLRDDRLLADVELARIVDSAARRAEEGVPLDAVLAAYQLGCRLGWDELAAEARPDEAGLLVAAAGRLLGFVQQVTSAVAAAYLDQRQTVAGEERDVRRGLVAALLKGEPTERYAARFGDVVASMWIVLELQIADHPDEADRRVGGAVAARRKLARVAGALEAWLGGPALSRLDPTGGVVLLPTSDHGVEHLTSSLAGLVADLGTAAGATVTGAWALAETPAGVPRAAGQAADVLRLVRELDRPPGVYALADVLLEYQLTRPSDAQGVLARLLDPLDRNPDLQRTVECYFACDLDRRRTAAVLHVHPNTLDYRLRRVVELTDLDPSTARGLQLLGAALAARRLAR